MPTRRYTYLTSPEQSKPDRGDEPPKAVRHAQVALRNPDVSLRLALDLLLVRQRLALLARRLRVLLLHLRRDDPRGGRTPSPLPRPWGGSRRAPLRRRTRERVFRDGGSFEWGAATAAVSRG